MSCDIIAWQIQKLLNYYAQHYSWYQVWVSRYKASYILYRYQEYNTVNNSMCMLIFAVKEISSVGLSSQLSKSYINPCMGDIL